MKQDRDWTNAVRDAFRDAEVAPPSDGWARLERELAAVPAPRVSAWRVHRMRIAVVSAALAACIAAGSFLWIASPDSIGFDGGVIELADGGGQFVTEAGNQAAPVAEAPLVAALTPDGGMRGAYPEPAKQLPDIPVPLSGTEVCIEPSAAPASQAEAPQTRRATRAAAKTPPVSTASSGYAGDFTPERLVHRKKTSLSLHAGGVVTGGSSGIGPAGVRMASEMNALPTIGDGANLQTFARFEYPENSFRHHQPLSFGFAVRKEFTHGLSLESGLNYTLLRSDVTLRYGSEDVRQKLHFVGIPLRMNWQFLERGHLSLYIGAGGMVEKCIAARFGAERVAEPGVQWSLLSAVGAQYRLGGVVGLYFEPEASYYLTKTTLRTSRTDSPLTLTLRLGVRFTF